MCVASFQVTGFQCQTRFSPRLPWTSGLRSQRRPGGSQEPAGKFSQGQDSGISPAGTNTKGITETPASLHSLYREEVWRWRSRLRLCCQPMTSGGPLWSLRSLGRAGSAPGWSNATGRLIKSQLLRGRVRLLCTGCWFALRTFTSHSPDSSVFFKSWRISFIVLSSSLFYSFLSSQLSMQEKEASPHGFLPRFQHFATQAIHVGQEPEQWTSQAVVPPISLSTTFKQGAPGKHSVSWVCLGRSSVGRPNTGRPKERWLIN